jgi:ABC-type lipoprotein export system ATPase subunit
MVTHDPVVGAAADRIVRLLDGRIVDGNAVEGGDGAAGGS